MGAAGGAIIFFMLMIGGVIVGLFVAGYAAHSFLTIVEDTAAGNDEVRWPGDPMVDWAWKLFYLAWLMAVWLVPGMIAARWLAPAGGRGAAVSQLVVLGGLFWALFPVSLMSSLSASSRWFIFTPSVLSRLIQRPEASFGFYALTFPLIAVGASGVYLLVTADDWAWMPVGAAMVAAAMFLYARLVGRLAHLLRNTRGLLQGGARRTAPRRVTQVEAAARATRSRGREIYAQDLPELDARDEDARVGYDVLRDDAQTAAAPAGRSAVPFEGIPEPYALGDAEPDEVIRGPLPDRLLNPPEHELALARRGRIPAPPSRPWTDGIWSFPFYADARGPCATLGAGVLAVGLIVRLMVSMNPA